MSINISVYDEKKAFLKEKYTGRIVEQ